MSQSPRLSFSAIPSFLAGVQEIKMKAGLGSGADAAKVACERRNILDLNIVIGIDCSGSISKGTFQLFMTQLNNVRGMSRIKVIEISDRVEAIYDFTGPSAKPSRLRGGGGNGEPIFFDIVSKLKPDCCIYMTDGMCQGCLDPGVPTGFLLTHDGVQPYEWGEVIGRLPPSSR